MSGTSAPVPWPALDRRGPWRGTRSLTIIEPVTQEPRHEPPSDALASELRSLLGPHLQVRHFRKGSLLWREGESSGMLVALTSGRVKAYRLLPTGRAVTLYLFGPGDVFGFLPFIDGDPYPANAQAIEDVTAAVMPRSVLLRLLKEDAALAPRLIAVLGRRLREALDMIESVSGSSSLGRVAAALLPLVAEAAVAEDPHEPPVIELPVPAHEFAAAIGLVPETFSRALSHLVETGALERLAPRRYRVRDTAGLERAAHPPVG